MEKIKSVFRPVGWVSKKNKPELFDKGSNTQLSSNMLLLLKKDGSVVPGCFLEYTTDLNAGHLKVKKGHGLFVDVDGMEVPDVVKYYTLSWYQLPEFVVK